MKALVTYFSETGNTEKLAHAVHEGIKEATKDIIKLEDVSHVDEYDVVFLGFPVHAHSVPGKAAKFIKGLPKGTKIAVFLTHGSLRGGPLAVTALYDAMTLASDLTVLGTFSSRGKVKSEIVDAMMKKPEHRPWAQEAQSASAHPDEGDFEDAREFAGQMITKARRM